MDASQTAGPPDSPDFDLQSFQNLSFSDLFALTRFLSDLSAAELGGARVFAPKVVRPSARSLGRPGWASG